MNSTLNERVRSRAMEARTLLAAPYGEITRIDAGLSAADEVGALLQDAAPDEPSFDPAVLREVEGLVRATLLAMSGLDAVEPSGAAEGEPALLERVRVESITTSAGLHRGLALAYGRRLGRAGA